MKRSIQLGLLLSLCVQACGEFSANQQNLRSKPNLTSGEGDVVRNNAETGVNKAPVNGNSDPIAQADPNLPAGEGTGQLPGDPPILTQPPATPAPGTPPAAGNPPVNKIPIRSLANATEITAAKSAYGSDCAGCHQAIANSEKKGASLARINAAGTAGRVSSHTRLINAGKWPKDTKDATDDGIDNAVLKASALVEALK